MENITERDLNLSSGVLLYENPGKVAVYKVHASNNKTYAVKKQQVNDIESINTLLNEFSAMLYLTHPSVIKTHKVLAGGRQNAFEYVLIIMDFFEEGDLNKEILKRSNSTNY